MRRQILFLAALTALFSLMTGCLPDQLGDVEMDKSIAAAADAGGSGGDLESDSSRHRAPDVVGTDAQDVGEDTAPDIKPDTADVVEADEVGDDSDAGSMDADVAEPDTIEEVDAGTDAVEPDVGIDADGDAAEDVPDSITEDTFDGDVGGSDAEDVGEDTEVKEDTPDAEPDLAEPDTIEEVDAGTDAVEPDVGTDVEETTAGTDASVVEVTPDTADTADTAQDAIDAADAKPDTAPDTQPDSSPDLPPQDLCLNGTKNCDDGNVCTLDSCDKAVGCINTPQAVTCEDGNFCTSGDSCVAGACVAGAPKVCSDSNSCTVDSCHPTNGCVFTSKTITYGYDKTPPLPAEWTKSEQMHAGCDNSSINSAFKYTCVLKVKEGTPAGSKEFAQLDLIQVRQLNNYGVENLAISFKMARFQSGKNQDIMSWSVKDASGKVLQSATLDDDKAVKLFEIVVGPDATMLVFSEELTTLPLSVGPALWGPVTITPVSCPLP